jgi:hypothetical protein
VLVVGLLAYAFCKIAIAFFIFSFFFKKGLQLLEFGSVGWMPVPGADDAWPGTYLSRL